MGLTTLIGDSPSRESSRGEGEFPLSTIGLTVWWISRMLSGPRSLGTLPPKADKLYKLAYCREVYVFLVTH
jgi:hypothetical protein